MNHPQADILIVDDTPENLRVLSSMLKLHDYKVRVAPNGTMAIKAATSQPPDLILLDVMMPDLDGYQVCQQLKAQSATCDIPVIFISALSETSDKIKAFEEGGVDYVTKPFQADELQARVSTHLTIRHLQRELQLSNEQLADRVAQQVKEISLAQLATISAMTKLAEARDDDTGRHIDRIARFCQMLAEQLAIQSPYAEDINESYIHNIYHASPLHDLGKIAIRDDILLKPGKLTAEEFQIMKTHTTYGAQTLRSVQQRYPNNAFVNMGICIAESHHEKWDGTGYPYGIAGDAIPLSARIMAVADVYDALRSKRVYKEAFSHEKSMAIMLEGRAKHFDPVLIDTLTAIAGEFDKVRTAMGDDL